MEVTVSNFIWMYTVSEKKYNTKIFEVRSHNILQVLR